jgi:oxidoreductase
VNDRTMDDIPLCVLGCGWVVQHGYLPHLLRGPFRVISIFDPDTDKALALQRSLPRVKIAPSMEALLAIPSTAILVATPNPTHLSLSQKALRTGHYVLCEKPVLVNPNQAGTLRSAERTGSKRLVSAAVCRYRTDVRQWLTWCGRIGSIRELELTWVRAQGIPCPGSWHTRSSNGWTGVLVDLGYHLLDLAVEVLENIPRSVVVHTAQTTVQGNGSGASWYENGSSPASKGDHAAAGKILTGEDAAETSVRAQLQVGDVRLKLRVSWVDDIPGDLTDLRAIGTNGQAELQGLFGYSPDRRIPYQRCRLRKDGELTHEKHYRPGFEAHCDAFGELLMEFAQVCNGAEPSVGVLRAERVATLMTALRESFLETSESRDREPYDSGRT